MRKLLMSMFFVAVLAPSAAFAQENFTPQGAELLQTGWAVEPYVGYPEVGVRFHIPINERFNIVPNFGLFFGEDLFLYVGNAIGAQFKIQVLQRDIWTLSVNPGFWLLMVYHPAFAFGFRLDPDVTATVRPLDWLSVYFGVHMPFNLYVAPNVGVRFPIKFRAGVDFKVAPNIHVWVTPFDIGPSFWSGARGGRGLVHVSATFQVGASFQF